MKEFTTRTEHIIQDSTGIVICRVLKDTYMELEDAEENINTIKKISNGRVLPVLVDIRASKGASRDCRNYYAGQEAGEIQNACALLIDSPFSRLLGNFFLGFNKTEFPTKLFTKEKEAMEWLKTFI